MNRRRFFTNLIGAAAAFSILPGATTYARKWVAPTAASPMWIPNSAWETAPYRIGYILHPLAWAALDYWGMSGGVIGDTIMPPETPEPRIPPEGIRFAYGPGASLERVYPHIKA